MLVGVSFFLFLSLSLWVCFFLWDSSVSVAFKDMSVDVFFFFTLPENQIKILRGEKGFANLQKWYTNCNSDSSTGLLILSSLLKCCLVVPAVRL